MRKSLLLYFWVLIIAFYGNCLGGVRVGEEIRIRWFAKTKGEDSYFYQRTRFFLEGVLARGVSAGIKIQSRGYWGIDASTVTIEGLTRQNMLPWIENAYVRVDELFRAPLHLTIGRQSFRYGNGILVEDNASGYDGIRLIGMLPLMLECELAMFRPTEAEGVSRTQEEKTAYALFVGKRGKKVSPMGFGFWERDGANQIEKNFYGAELSGELIKGANYRGGIILQSGKGEGEEYKARAYILSGNFEAKTKLGKGLLICEYLVGTGEQGSAREDFFPGYAHLSEEDYGEYYMARRSEIRDEDKDYAVNNMKLFKLGLAMLPLRGLKAGFNYFNYNSYSPGGNIGDEIDIYVKYDYSENLTFRVVYGMFIAGKYTEDNVDKFLTEILVRF